jgi:uncharacterized membrane protein YdjX (TVP38/TMEM64 family)
MWWRNRKFRRGLALVVVVLIVAITVIAYRRDDAWQWLLRHERQTRQYVHVDRPWTAFAFGLLGYGLLTFVPGLSGKALVVAWLFGFWRSLVIVNTGMTVAAVAEFWFTRYFFREALESRFPNYVRRVNAAIDRDGPFYLFSARVAHVPYTITNYLMGTTSMRGRDFWWATQLGMFPSNLFVCYAGSQFPSLAEIARQGVLSIFTPQVVIAFVAVGILPWIGRWAARWWQKSRKNSEADAD